MIATFRAIVKGNRVLVALSIELEPIALLATAKTTHFSSNSHLIRSKQVLSMYASIANAMQTLDTTCMLCYSRHNGAGVRMGCKSYL